MSEDVRFAAPSCGPPNPVSLAENLGSCQQDSGCISALLNLAPDAEAQPKGKQYYIPHTTNDVPQLGTVSHCHDEGALLEFSRDCLPV
jgi:hypothetical protein